MNSIIDAESGSAYILDYSKSYDITDDYGGYYSNNGVNTEESAASDSAFSEAEIENIAMNEDFITAEYALDILKSMSELDIEQNAKLTSSSLRASKSIYTGKTTYYWKLNIENGDKSSYASVKADDGFVKSYICYNYAEPVLYSSLQNSDDSCRASADAYIAKYYPDAAGEYVIDEEYAAPRYSDNDMISEFSYYYVRTVNGVRFDNDHITVVINPDDMTIERTYYERSDASFPSVKGSIGADAAQDAYWAAAPLNAMYTLYTDIDGDTVNAVYCDTSYTPKKLLLICKYGDYLYVDAKNGNVLTTSFDEYVYTANEYYTESSFGDISGSKYEKQITLLYNMDIIDGTENFSPEKTITISEFYAMLNACGLYFNTDSGKLCFDGSKDGRLLSREDALSCMVDALGYHDVASLEGIYKSPFTDGDKLSGAALGHTSIAYALGLADIFGDTLSPQTRLTRGEAAGLIYTYITGNF
ncbi:MAG: YcdB/YcdC domain-containing protein [Eubacteriales bacterium]